MVALRLGALLLLAVPFLASSPPPALAACGRAVDPAPEMAQAESVFVGRVIRVADFGRLATMQPIEIWKGPDLPAEVVVNGSSSGSDQIGVNDRTYIVGNTYVVVPFGSRSPFFDEACSGTHLHAPNGSIPSRFRDAIGTDTPRVPGALQVGAPASEESSGGGRLPLYVGSGIGVFLALWLVSRARKRRRAAEAQTSPVPARKTPAAPARKTAAAPARKTAAAPAPSAAGEPDRKDEQHTPEPADAVAAVAAVAGRKRRRFRLFRGLGRAVTGAVAKLRPSRSGLRNLETVRRKTRKIKDKQRAGAE